MAYLGLARKWRPQTFDDLVGQGHIATTILNAIKAGRVSQGYLFTGTRGIGKTSSARIFAKALRCQETKTPGIPCNKCNDCVEISEGRSVDVLEIDGASNNGVDAVREIRENAKYLPSNGKYKIYIIDEVHMLTTAAFNALLKTLEEPPAHVIFIFATTDPQKIPATVLSRTQRFDFKRVSQKDLQARLKFICDSEKVTVANDALMILAREAEGSMRDAVSLLDQVFAVGGGKITAETVTASLGLVDKQTILDCVSGILKREPLRALEAVGRVYLHGFDLKQFGREVLRYLRQIMVARLLEQNAQTNLNTYMDMSDVDLADVKSLIHERSIDDLDMLFRLLNHGLEDVARSTIPKMVMDVLMIKMATSEELVSLSDLASPADLGGVPVSRPESQSAPAGSMPPRAQQSQQAPLSAQAPQQAPAVPAPAAAPAANKSSVASEAMAAIQSALSSSSKPRPAPSKSAPAANLAGKSAASSAEVTKAPAAPQNLPQAPDATTWWKNAVNFVKNQRPLVGSVLENMGFESLANDNGVVVVTLGYTKDTAFYKDQLQSRAYNDLVMQYLKNHLGRAVRLEYKEVLSSKSLHQIEEESERQSVEQRRKAILESEAIKATGQLLGAKLEKLEIRGEVKT